MIEVAVGGEHEVQAFERLPRLFQRLQQRGGDGGILGQRAVMEAVDDDPPTAGLEQDTHVGQIDERDRG